MKTSKQIFDKLNKELMQNLIPLGNEPIYTNLVTDCNDPIFDKSLEEVKKIIEEQEFLLELETEYLHKEKERIMTAFEFGKNLNYLKTCDEFFNEIYES